MLTFNALYSVQCVCISSPQSISLCANLLVVVFTMSKNM